MGEVLRPQHLHGRDLDNLWWTGLCWLHGNIKTAMDEAAVTWNANQTYFVTNGTSTANKIVVQALTRPATC